ncbi:MAG: hypothetical protein LC749_17735 [Actinobacteria bacterium]|nr:hypothetical protein [Actinomycetota bacterium]
MTEQIGQSRFDTGGYRHVVGEVEDEGYRTPEEAALSGWPSAARARVLRVSVRKDRATVLVDTVPSHPMRILCERRSDGLWEWVSD